MFIPVEFLKGGVSITSSFILQKKAEEFLSHDIYPLLLNFPKSEKFALNQEIKNSCYRLIRAAIMSNQPVASTQKISWLTEADAEKTMLLVLCGIASSQKYITKKKLLMLQEKLDEIGRLIGGLKKTLRNSSVG